MSIAFASPKPAARPSRKTSERETLEVTPAAKKDLLHAVLVAAFVACPLVLSFAG
jgi:hypothetical protein